MLVLPERSGIIATVTYAEFEQQWPQWKLAKQLVRFPGKLNEYMRLRQHTDLFFWVHSVFGTMGHT